MEVSMHSIAICEDNPEDAALLQNLLDDYELAMNEPINVRCFADDLHVRFAFHEDARDSVHGYISSRALRPRGGEDSP